MFRTLPSFLRQRWLRMSRRPRPIVKSPRPGEAAFRPLLEGLEERVVPADVYHVTDGVTLAAAVQTANTTHRTSEIILDKAGTYNLSTPLTISTNMTITGATSSSSLYVIQPSSGKQERLFDVKGATDVSFDNLTLQGGYTSGDGGALEVETIGARVSLSNIVAEKNHSAEDGGAVAVVNGAALTISHSVFLNNSAARSGGGVYFNASEQAATVSINGTSFDNDRTGTSSISNGGGIEVEASLPPGATATTRPPQVDATVVNTSFVGDQAGEDGGGMWNDNVTHVTASNIYATNNTAVQDSGALGSSVSNLNGATFSLTNSYLASNKTTGPGSTATPDAGAVCFDFQSDGATSTGQVSATVSGNTYLDNTVAGAGGGQYIRDDATQTTFNATITGNYFLGNSATVSNVSGLESGGGRDVRDRHCWLQHLEPERQQLREQLCSHCRRRGIPPHCPRDSHPEQ